MARPIISYKVVQNIKSLDALELLFADRPILPDEESNMIKLFDAIPNGSDHPLTYRLNNETVLNFLRQISELSLDNFDFKGGSTKGYQVSAYILVGKPEGQDDFMGVIEPVAAIIPKDGSAINHHLDIPILETHYIALDFNGKSYTSKSKANEIVKTPDSGTNPTLKIHYDCEIAQKFLKSASGANFIFFQFARETKAARLTIITSCSVDASGINRISGNYIDRVGKPQSGVAYDDHDLLP